jgi:hypothetical protein
MGQSSPRTLMLEIDPGADPITGRLRDGERREPFVGWLGLARALERVLNGPGGRREAPREDPADWSPER